LERQFSSSWSGRADARAAEADRQSTIASYGASHRSATNGDEENSTRAGNAAGRQTCGRGRRVDSAKYTGTWIAQRLGGDGRGSQGLRGAPGHDPFAEKQQDATRVRSDREHQSEEPASCVECSSEYDR